MSQKLSRGTAMALAILAVFVLTACSGIPRTSGVNQGSAVVPVEDDAIEFLPSGPVEGATIEQILRGFVEASSSPVSDYAIARQFLTPEFAAKWDATTGVSVDAGLRTVTQTAEGQGQLTYSLNALVDSQGNYADVSPPQSITSDYSFQEVEGQWRISAAPNGVVMDRFTFDQVYQAHPLYFFDSTNSMLVPDVRFFPNGASASTRITKALLAGPSGWLSANGAAHTSFPSGTALVADTVPVSKGTATVDLNSAALSADPTIIRQMKQQLSASLQSVDNITAVNMLVDGAVLNNAISSSIDSVLPKPVDSRPLVLTDKTFGYWTGSKVETVTQLSPVLMGQQPSAITTSAGNTLASILTTEGASFVRNGNAQLVDTRSDLIAPALDNFGYLWSVPADQPGKLFVISTDGKQQQLDVPWTGADNILSLSLSRDGSRVLALLQFGDTYQLVVSALVRGEKSVPSQLGVPVTLSLAAGVPITAAWVDSTTVVSVSAVANGGSSVRTQVIGGQGLDLPVVTAGTPLSVAGANTVAGIRILTSDGQVLTQRSSAQWQSTVTGVATLAVQQ
ncbi:GerMN domain-containing protein [uncultured Aurantimicrobium sp.]|uniref:GerMN domain-containing protein n=1 Tax=uncultured Aurantimicrobium sp. TaxID=1705357 RepID=UPI00261E2516|nr:GerMN domain-containing protein [uncultured Aurantimicrobium sp.]